MHTACSKCDRHARAATPEHGPACAAELHKQRAGAALHAPTVNPGMMKSILLPPELAFSCQLAFREPFLWFVHARRVNIRTGLEAWQARGGFGRRGVCGRGGCGGPLPDSRA